ncbi:plasmid stabilization protein [Escherichia coli O43:H2]|uniref:plasmid stabilization protein n=1 Tax=Escherichia coli TaxID=562 RepID=UPI000BE1DED4|nr:plasmid stabilization protein [Escherichia coli]EFN7256281.1 plasmid stabilization protein [Escherichia coli O43:H2]EFA4870459.1 plasmid stabilization protein [Escherichia coli]EFA4898432.1 plasmid stabilization protein [Escherichia coli]EGH0560392.1 plasmid stabilization protein [Escherichia coli]EJH0674568.1 plasmid stabilization protein [Escherichia coli]
MNNTTHYENANFLRELAESLPRILPEGSTDKSALLQRLANEELARAEYDEQVRAKVAAARSDKRPGMSSAQLRQQLTSSRYVSVSVAISPVLWSR